MNYRETRSGYCNCQKGIFTGDGEFDIPQIRAQEIDLEGTTVIGFNYALTEKHPEDKIVHFFMDDYQFERVWRDPDNYIELLRKFRAVIAPDFSVYTDFPRAVQIFNHYRKHWLAVYWQNHGIKVIPNVRCVSSDTIIPLGIDWCMDGEPFHSTICVSNMGYLRSNEAKAEWLECFQKIMETLQPSQVLLFGKMLPEIGANDNIIVAKNLNLENKRLLAKKKG